MLQFLEVTNNGSIIFKMFILITCIFYTIYSVQRYGMMLLMDFGSTFFFLSLEKDKYHFHMTLLNITFFWWILFATIRSETFNLIWRISYFFCVQSNSKIIFEQIIWWEICVHIIQSNAWCRHSILESNAWILKQCCL